MELHEYLKFELLVVPLDQLKKFCLEVWWSSYWHKNFFYVEAIEVYFLLQAFPNFWGCQTVHSLPHLYATINTPDLMQLYFISEINQMTL